MVKKKAVIQTRTVHSFYPNNKTYVTPRLLHFKGDGWAEIGASETTFPDVITQAAWTSYEYDMVLAHAFNWYSQTQDDKSVCALAIQALSIGNDRKNLAEFLRKNKLNLDRTTSLLLRMAHLGFVIRFKEKKFVLKNIKKIMATSKNDGSVLDPSTEDKNKPNIQDRIDARIRLTFGHIEELFDQAITNNFKTDKSIMDILHDPAIAPPGNRYKDLIKKAEPYLLELTLAQSGKNPDLAEAYESYGKRGLKNMVAWWENVISDVSSFGQARKSTKKTRKHKAISPEKIVSKLKFIKSHPTPKLTSIDPTTILRSTILWVYNTRTRKIGLYIADKSSTAFDVKGTRILNMDPIASVQKTLRKPEKQLPQFAALGKPAAIKWFEGIKATEIKMKQSINKDCVLLKAFK